MWLTSRPEAHAFRSEDLVGGDLALDFANTVAGRNGTPRDWLVSYASLLEWATRTGEFGAEELAALERLACRHPAEADAALEHARRVREAIATVCEAVARGGELSGEALAALDVARVASAEAAVLESVGRGVRTAWSVERSGLRLVVDVAAARAVDLLSHGRLDRLRVCAGDDCGWVFLDSSKGGQRRWCDMATCGNVAKARRYLRRRRKGATDGEGGEG